MGESVKNTKENGAKVRTSSHTKRNKKKNKKRFFKFILVIVILILGSTFLFNFEAFNLTKIEVVGTNKYNEDDFKSKLNIEYGTNIFKQLYLLKKADYTSFSYLEKVIPRFKTNNTITFYAKERDLEYIAFDKENNKYYRLDKNGYILEECNLSSKTSDEVILVGIAFDKDVLIGSKIDDVYLKKINSYLSIKKEFETEGLNDYGNITKATFENSLTTISINDKLNVVFVNDKDLKYNMVLLHGILKKIPEGSTGTIDMTKENPIYSAY